MGASMDSNELIEFFKSGDFCKEFGHMQLVVDVYDDCSRSICKFCGNEEW